MEAAHVDRMQEILCISRREYWIARKWELINTFKHVHAADEYIYCTIRRATRRRRFSKQGKVVSLAQALGELQNLCFSSSYIYTRIQ